MILKKHFSRTQFSGICFTASFVMLWRIQEDLQPTRILLSLLNDAPVVSGSLVPRLRQELKNRGSHPISCVKKGGDRSIDGWWWWWWSMKLQNVVLHGRSNKNIERNTELLSFDDCHALSYQRACSVYPTSVSPFSKMLMACSMRCMVEFALILFTPEHFRLAAS